MLIFIAGLYLFCISVNFKQIKASVVVITQKDQPTEPPGCISAPNTTLGSCRHFTEVLGNAREDMPPTVTCPTIENIYYAEKGKLTAQVFWSKPSALDIEDGELRLTQTQGPESGSNLTAGNYIISWIAVDSKGQVGMCSIKFSVAVHRCPFEYTYLYHGSASCGAHTYRNIYGGECFYTCNAGYELIGPTSVQCLERETWSDAKPYCKPIVCDPTPSIEKGILVCSDYTYESTCIVSCDSGYTVNGLNIITCQANKTWTERSQCLVKTCPVLQTPDHSQVTCTNANLYGSKCHVKCDANFAITGNNVVICQDNQTWSNPGIKCIASCSMPPVISHGYYVCESSLKVDSVCTLHCLPGFQPIEPLNITCQSNLMWSLPGSCLDFEEPKFFDGCTEDFEVFAAPLGQKTSVNYNMPNATDNSGEILTYIGVPSPMSEFSSGSTVVNITVSDKSGNTATCQFNVSVKYLQCTNPDADILKGLVYNCPNGFVVGALCNVTCSNGTIPSGSTHIECKKIEGYAQAQWIGTGSSAPYCQELCYPGQYSYNGKQPCRPCSKGNYQPALGFSYCITCPFGMSTVSEGAKAIDECQNFDLLIALDTGYPSIEMYEFKPLTLTMLTWVYIKSVNPNTLLRFSLTPITGAAYFSLDAVGVYIFPISVSNKTPIRKWHHVALAYKNESVILYVDGIATEQIDGLWVHELWKKTFVLKFEGNAYNFITNDIVLSGVQLTPKYLSSQEVQEFLTTCQKKVDTNVLKATSVEKYLLGPSSCDTRNDCLNNPCGEHGTCFDEHDKAVCQCDPMWSGKRCQIPPNYCQNHKCANNATCVNSGGSENYTCICTPGFTGAMCDLENNLMGNWQTWSSWSLCSSSCGHGQRYRVRLCDIVTPSSTQNCLGDAREAQSCYSAKCPVNGNFGGWSDWSSCSVTCGGGVAVRTRLCDSPLPSVAGLECDHGLLTSTMMCQTQSCPACKELTKRQGHSSIECSDNSDKTLKICQIKCRQGLTIMPDTANMFQCGHLTNYKWSHQTDKNPLAILPDCAETQNPLDVRLKLDFKYESVNFSVKGELEDSVRKSLIQHSDCVQLNTCQFQVLMNFSLSENYTSTAGGFIMGWIIVSINSSSWNETPQYLSSLTEVERNLQLAKAKAPFQLVNISEGILETYVNQTEYIGKVIQITLSVYCPDGAALLNGLCVDCPAGSYQSENGSCSLCSPQYYQSQTRSHSCTQCPKCTTTAGYGSYLYEQCETSDECKATTVETITSPVQANSENYLKTIIIGVSSGFGGLILCIVVIIAIILTRKRRPKTPRPYDIPGTSDEVCDYETLPLPSVYDVIEDRHKNASSSTNEYTDIETTQSEFKQLNENELLSSGGVSYLELINSPQSNLSLSDVDKNDQTQFINIQSDKEMDNSYTENLVTNLTHMLEGNPKVPPKPHFKSHFNEEAITLAEEDFDYVTPL